MFREQARVKSLIVLERGGEGGGCQMQTLVRSFHSGETFKITHIKVVNKQYYTKSSCIELRPAVVCCKTTLA